MSGFTLKVIALVAMLMDHIIKSGVLPQGMLMERFGLSMMASYYLIHGFEWVGRIAFPIFAYMIAEGCRKTKNISRYIARLLLFGVVSEIPFDLALHPVNVFSGTGRLYITAFRHMNIGFTLALGATAIALYRKSRDANRPMPQALIAPALCILAGGLLAVDYSWFGVLLVLAAYLPGTKGRRLLAMAAVLTVLYLGYASIWFRNFSVNNVVELLSAFAGLLLIALYDGRRGREHKWLFYVFYPLHLSLLFLLRLLLRGL